jgi:hypothetical protein
MRLAARLLVPALALAVPASAGTASRPSVALTASPAHVTIEGSGSTTVRLSNTGARRVVVDVRRAGFALDLRGRPKIVPRRRSRVASSWLTVRPQRVAVPAGHSASLAVSSRLPRRAEPGDHAALVLLTTVPRRHAGVAVRMRLGVVVDVRAPGKVVRKLVLRGLHVRRDGRLRMLELLVVNRGNVTEVLARERATLSLSRAGSVLAKLHSEPRQLLPHSSGLVLFRYRGRERGPISALATVTRDEGAVTVYRTFRTRL